MESASKEAHNVKMDEEYLEELEEEVSLHSVEDSSCQVVENMDPLFICDGNVEPEIELRCDGDLSTDYAHMCVKCSKKFSCQESYKEHIALVHASPRLCGLCGVSFLNELGLRLHTMRMHPGTLAEQSEQKEVWCVDCKLHFADAMEYALHSSGCRPTGSLAPAPGECVSCDSPAGICQLHRPAIKCELCGMEMLNNRKYQVHFRSAHPEENRTQTPREHMTPCVRCRKHFPVKASKKRAGRHGYKCDGCKNTPVKTEPVHPHVSTDLTAPPHPCDIREQTSERGSKSPLLVEECTVNRPFRCKKCNKTFKTRENLSRHTQLKTSCMLKVRQPPKWKQYVKAFRGSKEASSHTELGSSTRPKIEQSQ